MTTEFEYKGYKGSCIVSIEDDCIHGRIIDINDIITYEGETVGNAKKAFEVAVDEYLAHCTTIGKSPDKPYSGSFNVRIGPDLHKAANQLARIQEKSLNDVMRLSVEMFIQHAGNFPVTAGMLMKHYYIGKWDTTLNELISKSKEPTYTKTTEVSSALAKNHFASNDPASFIKVA